MSFYYMIIEAKKLVVIYMLFHKIYTFFNKFRLHWIIKTCIDTFKDIKITILLAKLKIIYKIQVININSKNYFLIFDYSNM